MESTNLSESWSDLYVMLGTSSAALIGLLFVATSFDEIVNNTIYRLRARNLLLRLIVTLIQAAAILTPQPLVPLGGELLVASLFGLWFPLSIAFTAFVKNRAMGKSGNFRSTVRSALSEVTCSRSPAQLRSLAMPIGACTW